ncbi:caspase domain-containing protein [Streptomyces sp. NPDC102402]|uniref:caspase family protein n=1 Tax=Streptomyces sp. NPDC102402 TaxID=3366169 RepID=UPI003829CCC4
MADGLRLADPAASYAVLAGVSAYEHLDDLPAVANNVAALSATLSDTGVWGLPPDRIEIVEPEKVGSRFIWAVDEAAKKATDTLLVYYAGHGTPHDRTRELFLGLPGQKPGYPEETGLPYRWVANMLNSTRITARHIVVIIDSCYSGLGTRGYMSAGETLAQVVEGEFADIKGHAVLTSSAANKLSKAPVGAPYTAFTGELLRILESGIEAGSALLNVETLHREIRRRLPQQLPDLGARGSTNVVCFARNSAYIPAPPEPPAQPKRRPPVPQPPDTPPTLPPRMPVLVRRQLEQMARVSGFHLVRSGHPEPRPVARARQVHFLSGGEELIGVWQWKRSVFESKSLVFTSWGIRVSDNGVSFQVSYADFHQCAFEYRQFSVPGVEFGSVDKTYLSLSGPDVHWTSPPITNRFDVRHLADALNGIRRTVMG